MSSDGSSDFDFDGPYYPEQRRDSSADRADALIEAIVEDRPEDVITMLRDYPEIIDIAGGPTHCTALQAASLTRQIEVVSVLLENGADVHNKGVISNAPIHCACMGQSPEVVALLLSHGANIQDRNIELNMTPLNLASLSGNIEVLRVLLAHGANPRDRDFPANHPLHAACRAGQYEVVQILLDYGANLYDYDAEGRTPLHVSCEGGNLFYDILTDSVPMVCILVENGADPNHPSKDGCYILEYLRCSVPVEDSNCGEWGNVEWENLLHPLLEILLDYGAGAGLPCRWVDEHHSECNTTVLMCCFQTFRREAVRKPPLSRYWNYEEVRDSFEGHFIKISAAGLVSSKNEKQFEPPEKDLDWSESRREAFRVRCEEELTRMMTEMIADTSATYFSLLTRDVSVLPEHDIWGKLTRESCLRRFPIYGNMLHCSYLRIRRPIQLMKSLEFFSILSPSLLPDCAELVMTYLSNTDLDSLVALCQAYRTFMERKSLEVSS